MTTEFLSRHRAGVVATGLLIVSSILISLRLEPYILALKNTVWFFFSPQVVYSGEFFEKFDSLRGRIFHLVRVEGENTILREQLARMAKRDMERDALESENNRLRDLLSLKQKRFPNALAAEVVSRDIRDWFHAIIINKGRADGILASAAVVTGSSDHPKLVGRIDEVQEEASKILLITDIASSISVEIVGRSDIGLLEGRNKPSCIIQFLPHDSNVSAGDVVITAGLGGVFPPGVPVGTVLDISYSEDGFFKTARVKPFADFGSLREVVVLQRKLLVSKDSAP